MIKDFNAMLDFPPPSGEDLGMPGSPLLPSPVVGTTLQPHCTRCNPYCAKLFPSMFPCFDPCHISLQTFKGHQGRCHTYEASQLPPLLSFPYDKPSVPTSSASTEPTNSSSEICRGKVRLYRTHADFHHYCLNNTMYRILYED